jgi:hypothetical protein
MEGLGLISAQLAQYDRALNARLDRLESRLDTARDAALLSYYAPISRCGMAQEDLGDIDTRRFEMVIAASGAFDPAHVFTCFDKLREIYYLAFDPILDRTGQHLAPLSLRYAAVYHLDAEQSVKGDYENFRKAAYDPAMNFLLAEAKARHLNLGAILSTNALPVRNVSSLDKKWAAVANATYICTSRTILSEPVASLLCRTSAVYRGRANLKSIPDRKLEERARTRAADILDYPLMQEPLLRLADWALYFAPLYDYADLSNHTLFANPQAFLAQPNLQPRGPSLLKGALQTLTVALAQYDMLYGDAPAYLIADDVWDPAAKDLRAEDPTDERQKAALAAWRAADPYVQHNVAMQILSRAIRYPGANDAQTYDYAVQSLLHRTVDPSADLNILFGSKLQFLVRWSPNDPRDQRKEEWKRCTEEPGKDGAKTGCTPWAAIRIYGVDVPLPTKERFAAREFVYPGLLLDMAAARDRVAGRLAAYMAFDYIDRDSADAEQTRIDLARFIIQLF